MSKITISKDDNTIETTERVFNLVYKNHGYVIDKPQKDKEVKSDGKSSKTKKTD